MNYVLEDYGFMKWLVREEDVCRWALTGCVLWSTWRSLPTFCVPGYDVRRRLGRVAASIRFAVREVGFRGKKIELIGDLWLLNVNIRHIDPRSQHQ